SLFEVQEAADLVTSAADEDVNVIFGNVINENLNEEVIVTVIATGFEGSSQSGKQSSRPSRNAFQEQAAMRSEEHTSELQSRFELVCRLLLEKKNKQHKKL